MADGAGRSDAGELFRKRAFWGQDQQNFYRDNIEFPFFAFHLKDKVDPHLPEAFVFETGTNVWRGYVGWPPRTALAASLYLQSGGSSPFTAPSETAFDEYVSDPEKPVPYIAGQSAGMTREHMTEDQRFAASRPDVLVYQTEPLQSDVTLAGPLTPVSTSTTGTDSDFVVKLIVRVSTDDYPDNTPNPAGVRMGELSATGTRRVDLRGALSQQLFETGAFHDAQQNGKSRVRNAGHQSHVSPGASHHGAGAELVVSSCGSQSADLCGHL